MLKENRTIIIFALILLFDQKVLMLFDRKVIYEWESKCVGHGGQKHLVPKCVAATMPERSDLYLHPAKKLKVEVMS